MISLILAHHLTHQNLRKLLYLLVLLGFSLDAWNQILHLNQRNSYQSKPWVSTNSCCFSFQAIFFSQSFQPFIILSISYCNLLELIDPYNSGNFCKNAPEMCSKGFEIEQFTLGRRQSQIKVNRLHEQRQNWKYLIFFLNWNWPSFQLASNP